MKVNIAFGAWPPAAVAQLWIVRRLDAPMTKLNFLTACWWLFILFWVISAFLVKPTKERQDWGGRLFTFTFLTVTFLLLAGKIHWWGINARIWPDKWPLRLCGYTLTLAGLVILIWSRVSLGTNWSATVTFREGHELIERGPYRFVRHPMYSGILLMVAGTAIVLSNISGMLSVTICFLGHWWKLSQEEALLMKHFPDAYQGYRSRTKALIPFIL